MDASPHPGLLPIPQSAPAGAAASIPQFPRQVLPRHAGPQNEENAGQDRAIVSPLPAAPRLIGTRGEERLDDRPEVVWEDFLCHPPGLTAFLVINRGAVKWPLIVPALARRSCRTHYLRARCGAATAPDSAHPTPTRQSPVAAAARHRQHGVWL